MKFDIRELVSNPEDPELQETYDIVNDLVDKAGHVTIRDLYTKSPGEIGFDAWEAIQRAKGIGFMAISNKACCKANDCVGNVRGWCNRTPNGTCAAASDVCKEKAELG